MSKAAPRSEPLSPPPDWVAPRRTLILATTPRSGSNWIAGLIEGTGVMGRPNEWLGWWRTRGTAEGTLAGVREAATDGCTPNGIAGMKLFPFYLETALRHVRLSQWFPDAVWVHLVRRDLLAQAISLWRAGESSKWFDVGTSGVSTPLPGWGHGGGGQGDRYNRVEIGRRLDQLAAHEADWRRFFARTGITPVPLVYEEVMVDPDRALLTIAEALEVTLPSGPKAATSFAIQRDAESEAMRTRFRQEAGDPDGSFVLLHPFSRKSPASPPAPAARRGVRRVVEMLRGRGLSAR